MDTTVSEFRDSHHDCNQHLQKLDVVLLLDSQGNENDCKKELIKQIVWTCIIRTFKEFT